MCDPTSCYCLRSVTVSSQDAGQGRRMSASKSNKEGPSSLLQENTTRIEKIRLLGEEHRRIQNTVPSLVRALDDLKAKFMSYPTMRNLSHHHLLSKENEQQLDVVEADIIQRNKELLATRDKIVSLKLETLRCALSYFVIAIDF